MSRNTALSNLFVAFLLAVIYWLTLFPFGTRAAIERDPNYPQGVWILYADAFATPYPTASEVGDEAARELEAHLKRGDLAVESGLYELMRSVPKIYISHSLLKLGLIRLTEGQFPDRNGTLLAQRGGPYTLGERTPEGSVSGIAEIL